MELDDLKQPWLESAKNIKPLNTNVMEIIQNKSYGPAAQLKRNFRKMIIIIPMVVTMIIVTLSKKHDIFSDVLFWFYIIFIFSMMLFFYYNYRLINKMQCMDCLVKSNLEKQVKTLENGFKLRLVIIRGAFIIFIVLLEVLMYYQQEPALAKWYAQPVTVRMPAYAILITAWYFITKLVFRTKYGKHIQNLKNLVQQME
jgi:hypothetical protein